MSPSLSVVSAAEPRPAKIETVAERIRRLQEEVRQLGLEQAQTMRANVLSGVDVAREVALNPAQPEGIRQLAEKIVRDGESLILTLDQIAGRVK